MTQAITFDPTTNPDVQEALSHRYSDDIIMLLPMTSGAVAVFNSARELCGFIDLRWCPYARDPWDEITRIWFKPKPAPTVTKPRVDLKDLELL